MGYGFFYTENLDDNNNMLALTYAGRVSNDSPVTVKFVSDSENCICWSQ